MTFKLQDAMDRARPILNDTDASKYRYSSDDLLDYANGALRELVGLAPELFTVAGNVECVPSQSRQQLSQDDATMLVGVIGIQDGAAVTEIDPRSLTLFMPAWRSADPGPAVHWMRVGQHPTMFDVYPPAPDNQVLDVVYVRIPEEAASDEPVDLPVTVLPAITDYIVARAESRDDEHVNSNRAAQFMAQFVARFRAAPTAQQPNAGASQ